MAGLFSTFNIGKSGINVSQSTINTTSHNISNSNTVGYTRQRAKVVTSTPLSTGITGTGQMGTGAKVEAIERVRDTFIDYQVRSSNSKLGSVNIKNDILSQVEDIFNEPSDTGISSMVGKFFDSWQEVAKQPNSSNTRTVLAQNTLALTNALNSTYTKLEDLEENCQKQIKQNVVDVNTLLDKIDKINQEIKTVTASGETPNDLMDTRDNYLDQLSSIIGISTDNKSYNGMDVKATDSGIMVNSTLVSSDKMLSARLSYISGIETDPNNSDIKVITYYKLGDSTTNGEKQTVRVVGLSDEDIESLTASRVLWADANGQLTRADGYPVKDGELINAQELMAFKATTGEIAGNTEAQKDIREYKAHLNSLAKSLAFSINAVHSGLSSINNAGGTPAYDALPFFVNSDVARYDSSGNVSNISQLLDSENEITAKNITINKEILNDVMKIKTKTHDCNFETSRENNIDAEGDGARASAIASLRDKLLRVQDFGDTINSREDLFKSSKGGATLSNFGMTISSNTTGMTFDSFYQDTIDKLGVAASAAISEVSTQTNILNNLENSRDSVSGVSLDEEMANLIQYQHAYSANAKVISTVGELLDVIINGLIR